MWWYFVNQLVLLPFPFAEVSSMAIISMHGHTLQFKQIQTPPNMLSCKQINTRNSTHWSVVFGLMMVSIVHEMFVFLNCAPELMQVIPFKNEDAAFVFVYLIRRLIDRLIKAPLQSSSSQSSRSYLNGSSEGRLHHPELVLSFFVHLIWWWWTNWSETFLITHSLGRTFYRTSHGQSIESSVSLSVH